MTIASGDAHECEESYEDCMASRRARLKAAIAQNPHKSDRAIASDLGVDNATVSRARPTVEGATVGRRIGKDGKTRRLPKAQTDPAKSRIRLDLPPRVDASSTENTDHVEREYTNLITVWNNSSDPARARFLKAIGVSPSVVGIAA